MLEGLQVKQEFCGIECLSSKKKEDGTVEKSGDWSLFVEGLWDFQWTKNHTPISQELEDAFYHECQGIIDIAVKLFKMVQWRAIALQGDELITVELIRQVAKDSLNLVKPMLDYIRSPEKKDWQINFKDIAPINTASYQAQCLLQMEANNFQEARLLVRAKKEVSPAVLQTKRLLILELLSLDIEPALAKHCAEMVFDTKNEKDFPVLVKEAYELALRGEKSPATSTKPEKTGKAKAKYTEGDIRQIVDEAKKAQVSAYEALHKAGIVRDATVEDFLS
ncbi:MAG: hypothetical protein KME47_20875 [Nodosilinea sp. WJT8-NPBG4]|jgi:hypothetical protein|nr:hypothetical protein [Nodosilinea sp. WJT8-NPBG4]